MDAQYRIDNFFAEFLRRDVEKRFRDSEFSPILLVVACAIILISEVLAYWFIDTAFSGLKQGPSGAIFILRLIQSAVCGGVLLVLARWPNVRNHDISAMVLVISFSVCHGYIAYLIAKHMGRTDNLFLFSAVVFVVSTVLPIPAKKTYLLTAFLLTAAAIVNVSLVRNHHVQPDSFRHVNMIIILFASTSSGLFFARSFNRHRRLRFAQSEMLQQLSRQLAEEVEQRKSAEARLVETNEHLEQLVAKKVGSLRASEERFRTLVHSMPGFVVQLNSKGELTDCNQHAETLFGGGKSLMGVSFASQVFEQSEAELFVAVCESVRFSNISEVVEVFYRKSSDRPLVLSWNIAALRREDGESILVAVGQDVTILKNTQQLMIQTEKMTSLGGLAAGLAHELNSPLAGILQSIQVVRQRLTDEPRNESVAAGWNISMAQITGYLQERRVMELCGTIENAAVRSSTIIRDMLDFARQRNRVTKERVQESLDAALRLAQTDYNLKKQCNFLDIAIEKRYQSRRFCKCDRNALVQVFFNILMNGAHAMAELERPREASRFEIETMDVGSQVQVVIRDNGPGISREKQSRIFEPFFTTKEPGKGTGLGLSISYYIITEGHHGTITVESEEGKGAAFVICLPACET